LQNLPDLFQQPLPPTRTTPPQNIQSINYVSSTQFSNLPNNPTNPHLQLTPTNFPAWRPSRRLRKKLAQLFNDHYNQFPCLPCIYCGKLLYPEKAFWVTQKIYQLTLYFNYIHQLHIARIGTVNKLPTCQSCKKLSTRLQIPSLAPIPQEISDVPYSKRNYLSPIFLHPVWENHQTPMHTRNIVLL